MNICDNELCCYHKTKFAVLAKTYAEIFDSLSGEMRTVLRHAHIDATGKKFFLCFICHNAIRMAVECGDATQSGLASAWIHPDKGSTSG